VPNEEEECASVGQNKLDSIQMHGANVKKKN
jgi:hypothetical protein